MNTLLDGIYKLFYPNVIFYIIFTEYIKLSHNLEVMSFHIFHL